MRSSVSAILSTPTQDPNMSHPDYEMTVHDHGTLLILVKHLGEELSSKNFNRLFERICRINQLRIVDGTGAERCVQARYIKEYPVGNNDWGDFQTHRRLLGLITVSKCKLQIELNEICRLHESLKVKYQSTLYDSRCIIFGVNAPNSPELSTPSNFKSRDVYYASDNDPNPSIEMHLNEFLSSLFWVLDAKRLEKSKEKLDKATLLIAPFEKRNIIGLDMESRANKKRCMGRVTKHLADLNLQTGFLNDALNFYQTAIDTLRSCNDWLWLGGCLEGLCATSLMILQPQNQLTKSNFQRNASLQERHSRFKFRPLSTNTGFVSLDDNVVRSTMPQNLLSIDDIYKNYGEALKHYSKYLNAGVVLTEGSLKAARIAVDHHHFIHVHYFLQNVLPVNLTLTDEEKIQRLMKLAELYSEIGFHRKASFFQWLASKRYVSASNPHTSWEQCYQLLLKMLPGHKLSLDPNDYVPGGQFGWPELQRQVVNEIVLAAKRVGNASLATRHCTFLLQTMWWMMDKVERSAYATQLSVLSAQCEGSPVPLVLVNGLVIPPANLLNIPQPENFSVQNLKLHLRPHKLVKAKEDFGPFLFTPLKFGSMEKYNIKSNKMEYVWVINEPCEVILELSNPLNFELEVTNILLLTSGAVFESIPFSINLPPEISYQNVVLTGIPKEVGEIEINGYSTHTLGVKSNCRLKNIPNVPEMTYNVQVIPSMPCLEAFILDSKNETVSNITLFAGQSEDYNLKILNVGSISIDLLEISIESTIEHSLKNSIIKVDTENIKDYLPITPKSEILVGIHLTGALNFLSSNQYPLAEFNSLKSSLTLSGPSSYPSLPSPKQRNERLSPMTASSFRSGESSLNSNCSRYRSPTDITSLKVIEFNIKIKYAGGEGMAAGYCRIISCVLSLNIFNSVLVTGWDVLQAETGSQFYLVLDVVNVTNQEMELKYATNKSILMEEKESYRIPVPVDRFLIHSLEQVSSGEEGQADMVSQCNKHIAEQVLLRWSVNSYDDLPSRWGVAKLNGLTLCPQMLDIVCTSPIYWEINLNEEKIVSECDEKLLSETSQYPVGQQLKLQIWVHNSLMSPLDDVTLELNFYQDYLNGTTNSQLGNRLATTGSTKTHTTRVNKHDRLYHECGVIFFYPGQYKLNLQCQTLKQHIWKLIPPLQLDITAE
ncbi:protein brunelleschi [Rhopalosiphum maidis]|uniref:protein brunelleschi n=1 Tax=Rhopalosiphum maidis TaxID=43146 RepID=UPI000F002D73|nr:protein brunelleschi [Rhopalosiphum maidis]XP_026821895.1 protein brunelleschi [Rhopalosiphum maidis]